MYVADDSNFSATLTVVFTIYVSVSISVPVSLNVKVEENRPYRLHLPGEVLFSSEFTNCRSVFGRLKLASGRYVIIPATKEASKLGEYMLRMFSGVKCGLRLVVYKDQFFC